MDENELQMYAQDDLDEGWGDVQFPEDDTKEVEGFQDSESEAEADQPSEETANTETEKPEANANDEDADRYLDTKHFEDVKRYDLKNPEDRKDAVEKIQKGMDYDRQREKADTEKARADKYETFLNEMKGDFDSLDDFMADTRARVLSDQEGITYEQAMARINNATPATQQPQSAQQSMDADIANFTKQFPNIKAEDIPQSVWDSVRNGVSLVDAYGSYDRNNLRGQLDKAMEEIAALRQENENRQHAAGSSASSGTKAAKSKVEELWDAYD